MSSPNPMTREELLDSAALDAFGLLDGYDASLYTRSFYHAPPAVRNEILQLQAELVSDETFLPSDLPDPTLRQRVLDAVVQAAEFDAPLLKPLATIGRNGQAAPDPQARMRLWASGPFWRAAAFALCTGLLIVLYFATYAHQQYNTVAVLALNNSTDAQLEQLIGPTVKEYLFDPTVRRVFFTPTAANPGVRATVFIAEGHEHAFLVIEGLPPSATQEVGYALSLKDRSGNAQTIHRFASNGRISGTRFILNQMTAQVQNVTWEITDHAGKVLLASI